MAKYLVLPNPAYLTVSATVAAPAMVGERRVSAQETFRETVRRRTAALAQFTENVILKSAASITQPMMGTLSVAGDQLAHKNMERPPLQPRASDMNEVRILPALGALIVDDANVDVQALAASTRSLVLPNDVVPMVKPVPTDASDAQDIDGAWHLEAIRAGVSRSSTGLTGKGTLVGVLDTGIDASHSEFAGKKVYFAEFDANGNLISSAPHDTGVHGTHVSALIAGKTVGVAPGADLAVAAVLTHPEGGFLIQIVAGLEWLINTAFEGDAELPGVDVINASLGGSGYNPFLYSTLSTARALYGTLMIAAIGNDGRRGINHHGSPGNYDIVLGVGATDQQEVVAAFSDWGTVSQHNGIAKPDLCAPGVDILSAVPGGGMRQMSGTSMACPIVTGIAALLLEQTPALSMNGLQLMNALRSHATVVATPSSRAGAGRISL